MKKHVKYRPGNVNRCLGPRGPVIQEILGQSRRLPQEFYARAALEVAPDLLGLLLVHRTAGGVSAGLITETEAYAGPEDRACHAYNMRRTKRNEAMYGPPGTAYVYLVYGIHHCFNVVVFQEGIPHAVLVRSIEPVLGEKVMLKRRNGRLPLALGPGRLCQAMGIGKQHNGANLVTGNLYIARPPDRYGTNREFHILETPRIGIDYAGEARHYPWRFVLSSKQ
ncbi:MAG TPA: DNA-3-methyladenine glycosylase [Firmicutes bacterium]|nr:DNA-3-methyladenine glycosylase [Candidatus Fermentithermobacillaceae bacterium]